ncbi:MAG: Tetratricopeptide 2 repeat-containing protein [Flavisolibacter sp.]|jgi:tetratricopeptide (TPR) repeat protein|nr:Tetratricopeptide 2 repeat-containing protein [Flavisolibacter sp.]
MIQKLLLCAGIITASFAVHAQPLKTPAPSPTQTIKQDFGLGSIELTYSRPGMKGRKIFGDLVPYGKVWRTGANSATILNFSDEVIIGGTKVPAGKYGLLSIPEKDAWTLIISKQTDVTSPAAYKQEMDVVRVNVKPSPLPNSFESFSMQFHNVKATSIDLTIVWDKTLVTLPISTDVDTKVMAQINSLMSTDSRPYFNAAMYYMDNGKDLTQAITWLDKAIEQNPKAFWVYHQKANALAKQGKKEEAKKIANKSIELAKEQKNDDYVALNEKLLATLK